MDFIIGYFKIFSNSISNFDFYGVSIGFGGDNSKAISIIITIINSETSSNGVYSLNSYSVSVGLVLIILRLLMMVVLIALKMVLLNFRLAVKGCLRGPPYTTAPPYNAWGNAPVDDS